MHQISKTINILVDLLMKTMWIWIPAIFIYVFWKNGMLQKFKERLEQFKKNMENIRDKLKKKRQKRSIQAREPNEDGFIDLT